MYLQICEKDRRWSPGVLRAALLQQLMSDVNGVKNQRRLGEHPQVDHVTCPRRLTRAARTEQSRLVP